MKRLFIRQDQIYTGPLTYILALLHQNKSWPLQWVHQKADADLIFDHEDALSLPINLPFFESLLQKKVFSHTSYFHGTPLLKFPGSDQPDWLGTAFYMVNACQEYQSGNSSATAQVPVDQYGRFPFEHSYQQKFGVITQNLVQTYLDSFCAAHFPASDNATKKRPTKVFLSHDIDTIHGSFLQDGKWALKKGRLDIVMKLVMNEILRKPHWRNIDKIAQLHSEHDLKSTFFWLATQQVGSNGVKNADYSTDQLKSLLRFTESNGLHKSCNGTNFREELQLLPFDTTLNRYHFLKFGLPASWKELEEAGVTLDASLGFAEHYGFRNSYGLPYQPYNFETGKAFNFVEVPLNVMDGTLQRYMQVPLKETASRIIGFLSEHPTDAVVSILWHNTFFTNYKYGGYLEEYKKVLLYLLEQDIQSITPQEILTEFTHG